MSILGLIKKNHNTNEASGIVSIQDVPLRMTSNIKTIFKEDNENDDGIL